MRFNRRYFVQHAGATAIRSKFVKLSLMLSTFIILSGFHSSRAQSALKSDPLILLWQTTVIPDGMEINADNLDKIHPANIAFDEMSNCYVSSGKGYPVKKFDADGKDTGITFGTRGTSEGQLIFENGLAVDLNGNVYVADFISHPDVLKFDSSGKFLMKIDTEPPAGPAGIVVDSKGNLYVANHRTHDHYLQKFDSNGKLLLQWGTTGTGDGQIKIGPYNGPDNIAIDKQDNIYVTDVGNNRFQKFDSNGNFLAKFVSPEGEGKTYEPFNLAIDAG